MWRGDPCDGDVERPCERFHLSNRHRRLAVDFSIQRRVVEAESTTLKHRTKREALRLNGPLQLREDLVHGNLCTRYSVQSQRRCAVSARAGGRIEP